MRIALISDIHGNTVALRAVLDQLARSPVDQLVCLGDVATLGHDPLGTLDLLRQLGCACVLGNHDAFLLEPELVGRYTSVPEVVAAIEWCRQQLRPGDLDFLRGFQPTLELAPDAATSMLLFHGTPRSHSESLLATTSPEELDAMLGESQALLLAGGHTHLQLLRQHRGRLVLNPGSVGMPFKEYVQGQAPTVLHHAEYAVVELLGGVISVQLQRVPLDQQELRAAIAASATPMREMLL